MGRLLPDRLPGSLGFHLDDWIRRISVRFLPQQGRDGSSFSNEALRPKPPFSLRLQFPQHRDRHQLLRSFANKQKWHEITARQRKRGFLLVDSNVVKLVAKNNYAFRMLRMLCEFDQMRGSVKVV